MSANSDFARTWEDYKAKTAAETVAIQKSAEALNTKINALQNSPGQFTQEDQQLLNNIQIEARLLTNKIDIQARKPLPFPPADAGSVSVEPAIVARTVAPATPVNHTPAAPVNPVIWPAA